MEYISVKVIKKHVLNKDLVEAMRDLELTRRWMVDFEVDSARLLGTQIAPLDGMLQHTDCEKYSNSASTGT
jgi:hypothetical protein